MTPTPFLIYGKRGAFKSKCSEFRAHNRLWTRERPTAFPWPPRRARHRARLIGTPRLEFPATPTKQSPDPISNRDTLGYFSSEDFSSPTRFLTPASRLGRAQLEVFHASLVTHHLPLTCPPAVWRVTSFRIANPRLEFRATRFENNHLKITLPAVAGNREYIAVFQIVIFSWTSRSSNIRTRQFKSARELEA